MDRSIGHSTLFWLVDPLDGTKEFVKRTNEFTVNIALMEDQAAVLGGVHVPAVNITYYGGRESAPGLEPVLHRQDGLLPDELILSTRSRGQHG